MYTTVPPVTGQNKGRRKRKRNNQWEWAEMEAYVKTLEGRYSRETLSTICDIAEEDIDYNLVKHLLKYICHDTADGAILVFLPGWDDISKVNRLLSEDSYFSGTSHLILPLHSMMPTVNQREIFERPAQGVRKIILSTSIAETSITIDDIVCVVDCGKIKITGFDIENNIPILSPVWVSLANARQRRGRAGRVQSGICFHLYTKLREGKLPKYQLPEMQRTRLEQLCLNIKLLKLGKVKDFLSKALDPPSPEAVTLSLNLLTSMNAIDSDENLTPLGWHLAKLPLHPQTGKMLLFGAMFSCLDPILTVAARLDFKDAFVKPLGKEKQADQQKGFLSKGSKSDHITLINAFDGWEKAEFNGSQRQYCFQNFLSENTLMMLRKMKGQLAEHMFNMKLVKSSNPKDVASNINSKNIKLIKAVICAGLYPNVARLKAWPPQQCPPYRRHAPNAAFTPDGKVKLHLNSVNALDSHFESPLLTYHLKMKTNDVIWLYDCTMVPVYPVLFFGGKIELKEEGIEKFISVDEFFKFKCAPETAELIQKLRHQLDELLEYKISHPGCTNWDSNTQEGALLKAVVELITTEQI